MWGKMGEPKQGQVEECPLPGWRDGRPIASTSLLQNPVSLSEHNASSHTIANQPIFQCLSSVIEPAHLRFLLQRKDTIDRVHSMSDD